MSSDLKFKFGEMESGWLPITITTPKASIDIDASDVPIDPIGELIKAVENSCIYGQKSEAWLHLEPHFYKISFTPESNQVKLSVSFIEIRQSITSPGNEEKREREDLSYSCHQQKLLTAFWRGLKEFSSRVSWYRNDVARLECKVNEYKKYKRVKS